MLREAAASAAGRAPAVAAQFYEAALDLVPDGERGELLIGLALALAAAGRLEDSRTALVEALDRTPSLELLDRHRTGRDTAEPSRRGPAPPAGGPRRRAPRPPGRTRVRAGGGRVPPGPRERAARLGRAGPAGGGPGARPGAGGRRRRARGARRAVDRRPHVRRRAPRPRRCGPGRARRRGARDPPGGPDVRRHRALPVRALRRGGADQRADARDRPPNGPGPAAGDAARPARDRAAEPARARRGGARGRDGGGDRAPAAHRAPRALRALVPGHRARAARRARRRRALRGARGAADRRSGAEQAHPHRGLRASRRSAPPTTRAA